MCIDCEERCILVEIVMNSVCVRKMTPKVHTMRTLATMLHLIFLYLLVFFISSLVVNLSRDHRTGFYVDKVCIFNVSVS